MPLRTLFVGVRVEKPGVDSVESAPEAPSLFDYDIVIADIDSVFPPNWRAKIPADEYVGVLPEDGRPFRKAIEKLSKEIGLLTEKGGMLVCLMRPKRGIRWQWFSSSEKRYKTTYVNNYGWIPIDRLDGCIFFGSGKRIRLSDNPGPFARYLRMAETYWTTYFERIDKLDVQYRNIAFNDVEMPVAVEISMGKGSIVFLPLSEHENAGDILLGCATRSFKKTRERPPPDWMRKIRVPSEDADQKSLDEIAEKITKLQAEYDAAYSTFEDKTGIRKLLYEKDETLEEAVRQAFVELGFTLTKKDDKDWIASSDTGGAILEVTGSDASIDIDKLRQLLNYLIDDYKESHVEKKAILVGNHFANDPPETRGEPFTEKTLAESGVHSMCLLPTPELFEVICHLREGKIKAEDIRRKMIETVGIFKIA